MRMFLIALVVVAAAAVTYELAAQTSVGPALQASSGFAAQQPAAPDATPPNSAPPPATSEQPAAQQPNGHRPLQQQRAIRPTIPLE